MNQNIPTPRTDAEWEQSGIGIADLNWANFARQLERELAAMTSENATLRAEYDLNAQSLRESVNAQMSLVKDRDMARQQLAAEREKVQTLRDILADTQENVILNGRLRSEIREALDATK